jgi:hypothetical protein
MPIDADTRRELALRSISVMADVGIAVELGWVPPSPLYLLRSALAKRRARRAHG